MLNVDTLTVGAEFKNDSGEVLKVVSNFSDEKKVYVELEKVKQVSELIEKI